MHLLFLDESGQIDGAGLFALGGIAVRDTDWPELRDLWQETLADARLAARPRGQVARDPQRARCRLRSPTPSSRRSRARRSPRYVTLLDLELGPQRAPEFFAHREDIYATGLMFLAERFHHLLDAEDDLGMIVVDSRFREDDARLRRFFADLTKDGTPYMQLPGSSRGSSSGRATTRSASSAPTWLSR